MYGLVITLILVVAILLILVVLIQNPKGGGLSGQFGGSGSAQLMGVKKTGDLLEQFTWGLAIVLLALSVSTAFLRPQVTENISSPNLDNLPVSDPLTPPEIELPDEIGNDPDPANETTAEADSSR